MVAHGKVYQPQTLPGFVAILKGNLVGLLTYALEDENCEIGTRLLKAVTQVAREAGCKRLWLMWARPIEGNCTLVGTESMVAEPGDPNHYSEAVPQDYIDACREHLSRRFPIMRQSVMRGNWGCMYAHG